MADFPEIQIKDSEEQIACLGFSQVYLKIVLNPMSRDEIHQEIHLFDWEELLLGSMGHILEYGGRAFWDGIGLFMGCLEKKTKAKKGWI